MTRTYFELGRSGRGASITCATLEDLMGAAEQLAPGEYWIREVEWSESDNPFDAMLGVSLDEWGDADWGTLEVRGPGEWTLRALSGMQAGPGYLIV